MMKLSKVIHRESCRRSVLELIKIKCQGSSSHAYKRYERERADYLTFKKKMFWLVACSCCSVLFQGRKVKQFMTIVSQQFEMGLLYRREGQL